MPVFVIFVALCSRISTLRGPELDLAFQRCLTRAEYRQRIVFLDPVMTLCLKLSRMLFSFFATLTVVSLLQIILFFQAASQPLGFQMSDVFPSQDIVQVFVVTPCPLNQPVKDAWMAAHQSRILVTCPSFVACTCKIALSNSLPTSRPLLRVVNRHLH